MFLTPEEIYQLTGRKSRKQQVAFLAKRGYVFDADCLGRPIVLRASVEQRLGLKPDKVKTEEPNFEALEELYHGKKAKNKL